MEILPLQDRIIIKEHDAATKTKSGIWIPSAVKEPTNEGVVISVGEGVHYEDGRVRPMAVKAGDHILYLKHAVMPIKVDGVDFTMIREGDILGIIKGAPKAEAKKGKVAR